MVEEPPWSEEELALAAAEGFDVSAALGAAFVPPAAAPKISAPEAVLVPLGVPAPKISAAPGVAYPPGGAPAPKMSAAPGAVVPPATAPKMSAPGLLVVPKAAPKIKASRTVIE